MAHPPDCRILLPPGPLVMGRPFVVRVEVGGAAPKSSDRPMTLSMVGIASWRGLRKREVEFFRMESMEGEDRALSSSFQRSVHFEPPRVLPLPFQGERLRVRYELVVERERGELRAELDFVPGEPVQKQVYPSFRARMDEARASAPNASDGLPSEDDVIEVGIASRAVAPGSVLEGELSIETRSAAGKGLEESDVEGASKTRVSETGEVRVHLLRTESWANKSTELVLSEALIPAQKRTSGASRKFRFALPFDAPETLERTAFSCTWSLRFDVPSTSRRDRSRVVFDVPVEVRRDAAPVGHVPRVGPARRSAALEKYAHEPFQFMNERLSAECGGVEVSVVYKGGLWVDLRYPSLGLDPSSADLVHSMSCYEQIFGDAYPRLMQMFDTRAELRYDVPDDESIRNALREVAALVERIGEERLRLPPPPGHSLGTWKTLAEQMDAELLPAGPRVHGTLRGRAFVVERAATGLRFRVRAPIAMTPPGELPKSIRKEVERTMLGGVALEDGWIVLSTLRSMGRGGASIDAREAAQFLGALSELADESARSGPYR